MSKNTHTNYLKALYTEESSKGSVTTGSVARRLGVSPATVCVMLKRLEADGVIERLGRGEVALTARGRMLAERIVRKHRLLETFLYRVLGYSLEELHAEAASLESSISDTLEQRIAEFLGFPQRDPHGHSIPPLAPSFTEFGRSGIKRSPRRQRPLGKRSKRGRGPSKSVYQPKDSLASVPEGSEVEVVEVDDEDEKALRRLIELGILPDRRFRLVDIESYDGPVWVEGDQGAIPLAKGLAEKVKIRVVSPERSTKVSTRKSLKSGEVRGVSRA